jgi:ribosomal protein L20
MDSWRFWQELLKLRRRKSPLRLCQKAQLFGTYRCEHEYRFVSETKRALPLRKEWIYRVTVSSKMNNDMFDYFKELIKKEHGIDLSHSTFEKDD